MTDLPHLVMDLRMELPEPFKCPDACYMLSGFVDTLSIRELFPYCPDAEFVEQSWDAQSNRRVTSEPDRALALCHFLSGREQSAAHAPQRVHSKRRLPQSVRQAKQKRRQRAHAV
ncbi:hypothetical protein GPALN_013145 [Globodera pallida]|nr:hypothetical protein GPALN_013145 [Globodera pallida]